MVSPFHAREPELRGLPPLYFAAGGSDSMLGDAVILATHAARFGVMVAVDIFHGMWHNFHLYSEGCGSTKTLWQGVTTLQHTGDFVRQLARTTRNHPGRMYAGPDYNVPQVTTHYFYPTGHAPWIPVQPLALDLEAFAEDFSLAAAPSDIAMPPVPVQPSVAPQLQRQQPVPNPVAARALAERRLGATGGKDQTQCPRTTVVGTYVVGAVGGAISMILGLAGAYFFASRQYGLSLGLGQNSEAQRDYEMLGHHQTSGVSSIRIGM